ncbi:MAG: zinc ribbon domain-containing protein [Lachnospiraceae bacterium]|nr:zinc ribbon domain-containing protein [Lachnospiraceae bacterium]
MICAHCGREVPDGTVYCLFCGQSTANPAMGSGSGMNAPKPKPARSSRLGLKILIPVVILLLIAAVVVFAGPFIANTFMKLTSSPEDYCRYVLKKNLVGSPAVKTLYGDYIYDRVKNYNDSGISGELGITLSDDAQDMLEDDLHIDGIESLSDVKLAYEQNRKGDKMAWELKFSSGKKSILTVKAAYDGKEEALYFNIPEVNTQYAKVELGDVLEDEQLEQLDLILNSGEAWAKALPEPKQLQKIVDRYLKIAIAQIDDVKKKDENLKIGGVKQKSTALTIEIDEELIQNIVEAICEEAVEDKELEDIFFNIVDVALDMEKNGIPMIEKIFGSARYADFSGYGDDRSKYIQFFWDYFVDALEEAEDHIDKINFGDEEYELKLYVSSTGQVQGGELSMEDSDSDWKVSSVYALNGTRFGYEAFYEYNDKWSEDRYELTGEGKLSGGKLKAEFELASSNSSKTLEFAVDNMKVADLLRGKAEGELSVELDQFGSVLKRTPLSELDDQTAVIHFALDKKKTGVDFLLRDGKDEFAKLSLSGSFGKAGSISVPSDSKCDEIGDADDFLDYIDDCDFEDLADDLEDLGMPEEVADWIEKGAVFSQLIRYISKSKVSQDTQLADAVHTAVLTALMDPFVVTSPDYDEICELMQDGIDITQYTGKEYTLLGEVAEIMGVDDLHELSGKLNSAGATGRIWVYLDKSGIAVKVVLEGTDSSGSGNGGEITVY